MHAVVCIKQVPDTEEKIEMDPEKGTLVREGIQKKLNNENNE